MYENQIVGIHQRAGDLKVNVCRQKQLTNMRSAGARRDDESLSPFPAPLLDLSWTPRRRREDEPLTLPRHFLDTS